VIHQDTPRKSKPTQLSFLLHFSLQADQDATVVPPESGVILFSHPQFAVFMNSALVLASGAFAAYMGSKVKKKNKSKRQKRKQTKEERMKEM